MRKGMQTVFDMDRNRRLNTVFIDESWPSWKKFCIANAPTLREMLAVTIVILMVFSVVFRLHIVEGVSMEPTFRSGSIILGNHISPQIEHGTIIVCKPANYDQVIIKRVIGMPGDTVDIDFQTGIVYVNGEALKEDYIKAPTRADLGVEFPLTVDAGCYFVLGDNRNNSLDSRYPDIGLIHRNEIISSYIFTIIR